MHASKQHMFKNRKWNSYYGQCNPVIFMKVGGGGENGCAVYLTNGGYLEN